MKILIVQLARLGDIYLSWPIVNAIKRSNPNAEVHLLTREKFAEAQAGLRAVDKNWKFTSKLYIEEFSQAETMSHLELFLEELKSQNFNKIINLSFSPLSSYLVHNIATAQSEICGYTRNMDGSFSIPDDASAYFYAQVGVGRSNRLHLTKLFSSMCGVDILREDWNVDQNFLKEAQEIVKSKKLNQYVVLHVAASVESKSVPVSVWRQIISETLLFWSGQIVLIGSESDLEKSKNIVNDIEDERLINLVGETSLKDIFGLIYNSQILLGPDSSPMHIASLLNKPCLSFSNSKVNFWETGPLSERSRVCCVEDWLDVNIEQVNEYLLAFLTRQKLPTGFAELQEGALESYTSQERNFKWDLIKALYFGEDFPILSDIKVFTALQELRELMFLVCDQISLLNDESKREIALKLISRADELIDKIKTLHPEIRPLIEWFQTEKIRIQPGSLSELIKVTDLCYRNLNSVLDIYLGLDRRISP